MDPTRRLCLKSIAALAVMPSFEWPVKTPVIEWNAHIFSPDTLKYPFHPKAVYQPDASKYPPDPLNVYLGRMKEEGIDRAIIVHPEPYGDDHRLILDCLRKEPARLRGTTLFYPNDPKAPSRLESIVKEEPRIIATRFHAHRGKTSYFTSFNDAGVRALWKKCVDLDLIVELHIGPDYARQVADMLKAFPGSKVLIDHMAEPQWGSAVEFSDILELARFPGVYMKLSGLGHFAEDAPLYRSVLPFTKRVISEFGPDNLVWGSGPPSIVDVHMEGYSENERAKVKGGNLDRIIKWDL